MPRTASTPRIASGHIYLRPFDSLESYVAVIRSVSSGNDPLFHAIIDSKTDKAVGIASYLRIDPAVGSD